MLIRCTTGALTRFWCLEKGCYLRDDFPLSTSATPCVKWQWWYRLLIKIISLRATADFSCCSGQALQCSLLWARQDKQALVAEPLLKAHLMLSTCCLRRVTKRSLSSLSSLSVIFVHLASDLDIARISWVDDFLAPVKGHLSMMISSQLLAEWKTTGWKKRSTGKLKISRFHCVVSVTLENRCMSGRTDRRQ